MTKRIAILGSTGSIGRSTLDVAAHLGTDCAVCGLAAKRSWQALADSFAYGLLKKNAAAGASAAGNPAPD